MSNLEARRVVIVFFERLWVEKLETHSKSERNLVTKKWSREKAVGWSDVVHCFAERGVKFNCLVASHLPHFPVASIALLCRLRILKCSEVRANKIVCKFKQTVSIATYPYKMPVIKAHDQPFDVKMGLTLPHSFKFRPKHHSLSGCPPSMPNHVGIFGFSNSKTNIEAHVSTLV